MDYTYLIDTNGKKRSRIGVIGATRGYGYTLLVQVLKSKLIDLRVICSRHPEECSAVLEEIGYDMSKICICESADDIRKADPEAILIVADYRLTTECGVTSIVECTGNTAVSSDAAVSALKKGINVYMVSKETDSVCGPALNRIASENHAVYALVNGDQPRNVIDLYSWARMLGLEVIAAGKSSEYDFVWNRETGELTYTDGSGKTEEIRELLECWRYEGKETLEKRKELLKSYLEIISADLCEMNLVSNITGLLPASDTLDYPILKTSELADVFVPEEDGGILKRSGVVNVFYHLREYDEASFCGGEFVIVRCENKKMWDLLEEKGHIVSRNKKYACIYLPYHFMGMETPASIALGDYMQIGGHPECRQISVLGGVAAEDLEEGRKLTVQGHHHEIRGLSPRLFESRADNMPAPYYLLNGAVIKKLVKKDEMLTLDHVELKSAHVLDLFLKGLSLKR